MAGLVLKSLGDRARLVEEAPCLTLLDSGDAADLEQRDARGELEHQGLAGLRNGGEERGDPTAVSHPIRRVTACDASARLLVPACRLEALAGLIEVMGEERGVRRGRRSVDREQGSRDGGVGPAPAIQKLCAVGDLLREGMPEGVLTRRLGGAEKLGGRKALERRGELGRGQIDHGAQQLDWHVSPDHGRGLEHVLVAVREPIDARREDGLNGLGQRDLLDRGGQPVGAAFTTQHATLDERANHLLDEEWVAASPGLDPGAQGRERVVGSEPVVEQRPGVLESEGRKRENLDP